MARFLRLDRMEISGFKSFYGRTRFEFPEGITAVVGPNGCGKSNIGDAISWVLGEQKASSLRSERMEDVIFSGSEARRPLGMAEVSLHFKNISESGGNGGPHAVTPGARPGNGGPPRIAVPSPANGDEPEETAAPTDRMIAEGPLAIPTVKEAPGEAPPETTGGDAPPQENGEQDESGSTPSRPGARFFLEDLPDDVVVTRRLYRSGESEYALNGRRCRLRDVQDLLAMTEIGSRLYASIEQGRIDQVLTAKPKDRRAIIEEAAGILGYKIRRRQAESKLEAAQANLLRISDITGEVEKQIGSLKRQAAKARRYRRLQDSLRDRRAVIVHRRGLALEGSRRAALEALANLRGRHAAAAAEVSRAEAELQSLRLEAEQAEEATRRRRDEIHALDMEIDRMRQRRSSGEEQTRELRERLAGAEREIEELRTRAEHLAAEAERLARETDEVSADLARGGEEVARTEGERDAIARRIEEGEGSLEAARGELMRCLEEVAEIGRARAALEQQVRIDRNSVERLDREIAGAAERREELARTVAEHETGIAAGAARLEERAQARDRLVEQERAALGRVGDLERRVEELKGRASALSERLESLQSLERHHAGYARGVGEILDGAAGFAARGLVAGRLEVPRGLEKAVTAALGELPEAVMVTDPDDALRGVSHLRRHEAGRVAFILDSPESSRSADAAGAASRDLAGRPGVSGLLGDRVGGAASIGPVAAILSRTVLVDDLRIAVELRRDHPEYAWVTAAGDCLRPDGTIVGGDGPELHHGILVRRAEIAEVSALLSTIAEERARTEDALLQARAERTEREEALQGEASMHREEEKTLLEQRVKLDERRDELDRLAATLPLLEAERERLRREAEERAVQVEANAAAIGAAGARRNERESAIREAAAALAAERSGLERAGREAAEARARLAGGEQRAAALARERRATDAALAEVRARLERIDADRSAWADRIAWIAAEDAGLAGRLEEGMRKRGEAASRDEAGLAGLAYNRSLLHAREQKVKEIRAAHDATREELQEREVALARLESDRDHLEASCRDDLGLSLTDLNANPPAIEEGRDLESYERELEELRASLDGIGPVNLMAIEQYTELEQRFGFLSAQKKDLEDSVASLRESIRRINRESRQRFLAAFESIQTGFQECFATLFGGGRAELRLQDGEEDVLEAGIEIAAQPPGKRLQSLALLSGGEKALTAVALLFALFRYKPSPFCVLDEVDAPLDEANVERFTRMLQEMREDTQFILITHNRKSMEAADLLYGVTMEEPGVSKVLPLRFE